MPNTTAPVGAVEPFDSPDDQTSSAASERRESEKVITDWEEETRRLGRALALMTLRIERENTIAAAACTPVKTDEQKLAIHRVSGSSLSASPASLARHTASATSVSESGPADRRVDIGGVELQLHPLINEASRPSVQGSEVLVTFGRGADHGQSCYN